MPIWRHATAMIGISHRVAAALRITDRNFMFVDICSTQFLAVAAVVRPGESFYSDTF